VSRDDAKRAEPNPPDAPNENPVDTARAPDDSVARAARQAMQREAQGRAEPEPSLGSRLGQIGILGWTIVVPTLLGLVIGHWLDRHFGTGVFFAAPLLMVGAGFGLWSAWKWMHSQTRRK
jgi:ATP synthase protein I